MLRLAAEGTDGTALEFINPLSLELNKAYGTPCHQLVISFALTGPVGEIAAVTLYSDADRLFHGIADRQLTAMDGKGLTLTLECRSPEALLVDNEALPRVQYYAKLSAVARQQAAPYGIQGVRGSDPSLSQYTVYKGTSVWNTLDRFCRQTLGYSPRVDNDGWLNTAPPGAGRVISVSNLIPKAWSYLSIRKELNRCEVLSEVRVNNRYGSYATRGVNPKALGVQRMWLLNPSGEWANLPKQSAQEAIRASMLEKERFIVTLPAIARCDIGDVAELPDEPFAVKGLFIGGITYALNEGGLFTTLELYNKEYI